jgi:hypothetical protein
MKKDLLIGGFLVVFACLGIGAVILLLNSPQDENLPKTVLPKTEPVVYLPSKVVKEKPKEPIKVRRIPIKPQPHQKQAEVLPAVEKAPPKENGKSQEPIKLVKTEPQKLNATWDVISLGDIVKINNPAMDYEVKLMNGREITLLGKVKSLTLHGANVNAVIDASELRAQEVILTGAVDGGSRVKLWAPEGTVLINGAIRGRSHVEIQAPGGKVVVKGNAPPIINGESRLSIVARDVELLGEINGPKSFIEVTLTKAGSLKFTQLLGTARLHYGKQHGSDPEPRLDRGVVNAGAELKWIGSATK